MSSKLEIFSAPSYWCRMKNGSEDKEPNYLTANNDSKSYPKIKIIGNNLKRPGQLVVTCVNKNPINDSIEAKYHIHPNKLIGEYCDNGIATYYFQGTEDAIELKIGIQNVTQNGIAESLKNLKSKKVDPLNAGYEFNKETIDLNQIRLCFQAFFRDKNDKIVEYTPPIVSKIIFNASSSINVIKMFCLEDYAPGGKEIVFFVKMLSKEQRRVYARFFENIPLGWSGIVESNMQHCQSSLVFKVPPFKDSNINDRVVVNVQLFTKSDNKENPYDFEAISDIYPFTYLSIIKPIKRPLAFDEYYECEQIDSKNSTEIKKKCREDLAERTKDIWALKTAQNLILKKAEEIQKVLKPGENLIQGSDLIANNFQLNYSNFKRLHFLYPNLKRNYTENNSNPKLSIYLKKIDHPKSPSSESSDLKSTKTKQFKFSEDKDNLVNFSQCLDSINDSNNEN